MRRAGSGLRQAGGPPAQPAGKGHPVGTPLSSRSQYNWYNCRSDSPEWPRSHTVARVAGADVLPHITGPNSVAHPRTASLITAALRSFPPEPPGRSAAGVAAAMSA